MILLDTNVVSELTRNAPEPRVTSWLDAQAAVQVGITAITVAELAYGLARLPAGRRKAELAGAVGTMIAAHFDGRVWPFDVAAAAHYARVVSAREGIGRPIGMADAQIAAICHATGAGLATRNTADFAGTGIAVFNPWDGKRF
jgi:toxin FitB